MSMTSMRREAGEAAAAIRAMLAGERATIEEAGRLLSGARGPVTTAARGSSDHAVTAFKYACEILTGRPVASIGPSVASVYDAPLKLEGGLHLTVSQSGASPDIIALQRSATRGGARTIAIVNNADSPLANAADLVIPVHAGEERSVAATKSYLASCAALFAIVANAVRDERLLAGLAALPAALDELPDLVDERLVDELAGASSLYVTGRGPAFGVALEAALKAKETAGIHAEAFSVAELMHGPLQLVRSGFPVVAFVADDAAARGTLDAVARLRQLGSSVSVITTLDLPVTEGLALRTPTTGHFATDALVFALAWYRLVEATALRRGLDPDRPTNLRKVTQTL